MKKLALLAISVFVLSSCTNNTEKSSSNQDTTSNKEHHDDKDTVVTIQLNSDEKWLVNDEMKPFVSTGESLVNSYLQNNQTDYKALAKALKVQNNRLTKSCTMNGKSHEEVHKWLHPHIELVEALEKETNSTKATEIVGQLQGSYQTYHQYFN